MTETTKAPPAPAALGSPIPPELIHRDDPCTLPPALVAVAERGPVIEAVLPGGAPFWLDRLDEIGRAHV